MILLVGSSGVLGTAIRLAKQGTACMPYTQRLEDIPRRDDMIYSCAILCAGTKGHAECEGNAEAFRADVDGNIRLAKHLLRQNTFVVFVSTDAVEKMAGAYAR